MLPSKSPHLPSADVTFRPAHPLRNYLYHGKFSPEMESDHKGIIIPVYLAKPPHLAMVSQAQLAVAERLLLDQESYRVVSYSLTIIVAGRALKFDRTGDRLTEDMREVIANLASGKVLYFENVFAKSVSGEEVVIPWCIFRVQ